MTDLFDPLVLRGTTLRNRIAVSPMCQYSCEDGLPTDWHLVHLGQYATGGAGLVLTEAAAVSPEGRISPQDAGLWNDAQVERWARVTAFLKEHGATPGVQLAHAGRKASTFRPWADQKDTVPVEQGGWQAVGPSALAFGRYAVPEELDEAGIAKVVGDFVAATHRAAAAGFEVVELHAAHGYLLHQFLSPLSNARADRWGGSFENRTRLLLLVAEKVREVWAGPLLVRISGTDWVEDGWTLEESVRVAPLLAEHGVDLVDVSSGGLDPRQQIDVRPGYQVPLAQAVRAAGIPTGAVGLITEPVQAQEVVRSGQADLVLLARELLRDPHFALRAAEELGVKVEWPAQYARAQR